MKRNRHYCWWKVLFAFTQASYHLQIPLPKNFQGRLFIVIIMEIEIPDLDILQKLQEVFECTPHLVREQIVENISERACGEAF